MNRLNKRKIKRPHIKEYSYADTRGKKPDYSYVYIPINKKQKYHRSQTRKLIAKKINKRFDAVEKDDYYSNIKSEKWRMLKTNYDAYMNISPAERRTVEPNNMRGFQYDQFTKILYSFEDGCVYSTEIDPVFNKINVLRKLHDMTDIEKRAVYDNPIKYTPVSAFRIRYPNNNTQFNNDIIIKMDESIENVANKLNTAAENINTATENFIAQQNNLQQNINANQQAVVSVGKQEEENIDLQDGQALHYNRDGSIPVLSNSPYVYRNSKTYKDLIKRGFVDSGKFLYIPDNSNIKVDISQNIHLTDVLSKLDELISKMNSIDIGTNFGNILTAINSVNTRIQDIDSVNTQLQGTVNQEFNSLIENTQKQLTNMDTLQKTFTDYINLMKSTQQIEQSNNISKLVTDMKTMVETTNKMYSDINERLQLNEPTNELTLTRPSNSMMTKDDFLNYFASTYDELIKKHISILDEYQNKIALQNNEQLVYISSKLDEFIKAYNESYSKYKNLFESINSSLKG